MTNTKTTVILGGGVGGVVTATTLAKKLPKEHQVIIVDRERDHLFSPSLLWLMTGKRTAAKVQRPLERLKRKGIEVRYGDIERIDPVTRRVTIGNPSSEDGPGSSVDIDADYLVVSLGAELAPETVPGLEDAGHNFYTLAGAESFRSALGAFDGGRIVVLTATPAYKCPAAPYEAAMLIKDHCERRGLAGKAQVDLYAAEPGPMGVTGAEVSAGVRAMVEDNGIGYHPEHQVSRVDAQGGVITFDNGTTANFDLLAYVPPHRAPRVVRESGLIDESGWIPVDRNTMDTRFRDVYAIGDVVDIPLKMGKPLPMAGVFAEREGVVVANNVAHAITGSGKPSEYDGFGECFVETGGGKAGFGRGNFYADPAPQIKLYKPNRRWHIGKVLFEKNWFRRWV